MCRIIEVVRGKLNRKFKFNFILIFNGGDLLEAGVRNNLFGEIENIKTDEIMAQVTM
ncbi:MAG: hypothetical protein ACOX2Q_07870 [Dehalobacterium sp.]